MGAQTKLTMEETTWEDVQLDVEERLFRISQPRLEQLAVFLDVDVQLAAKRGRLHVAKCLQKALEKILDKKDEKLNFLKDVLDCSSLYCQLPLPEIVNAP